MLTWQGTGGFSLDASVRIHGSDRAGRERLLRYCARPPFALERLRIEGGPTAQHRPARARQADRSGPPSAPTTAEAARVRRVFYRPAHPTPDGRTLLALAPLDFLDALARIIPPPRVHRHRYHGVLAPNARLRARVVALAGDAHPPPADGLDAPAEPLAEETGAHACEPPAPTLPAAARSRWARLLARIYEVFPLRCPQCGSGMRILAFLTDPGPVGAILRHLASRGGAPAVETPGVRRRPRRRTHGLGQLRARLHANNNQTPGTVPALLDDGPTARCDRAVAHGHGRVSA